MQVAPGSDEELVANFLRGDAERRFRLLCGLRDTILAAPGQSREPSVGAVKLEWWRQELARLATGAPRHPLTTGLQALLPADSHYLPWLEELLICAESMDRREAPDSIDGLRLHCFRRESAALTLAAIADMPADASTDDEDAARTAAKHAGIAWGLAKTAAALAEGRQLFLLPRDLAADAGLDDVPAGRWREQQAFREAIRRVARAGLDELDEARQQINSTGAVTALVGAVSEAHLAARSRGASRRAHPLQLLWRAWRAGRRQARNFQPRNPEP